MSDLVGILHLQGGTMRGFNDCPSNSVCAGGNSGYVRMLDDFKMGPNLVRGFQPAGIGPRDITFGTTNDNIGGTNFWGASLEFQYPFYFLPKDFRLPRRRLRRCRIGLGLPGRNAISAHRRNQRTIDQRRSGGSFRAASAAWPTTTVRLFAPPWAPA